MSETPGARKAYMARIPAMIRKAALIAGALLVAGCAIVNVSLAPEPGPLRESVVEGEGKEKILLVSVSGVITARERKEGFAGKAPSLPASVREQLIKAAGDKDVAGVVISIDSPGGTVGASDAIYHEVAAFREKTNRPVYASITGTGTSGAYYIACGAEKIYAHPAAVTGSIGVIAVQMNIEGLMQKLGIEDKTYATGRNKALFTPFRADTPEEQEIIKELLGSFHERFVGVVHEARREHLTREQVSALADGRPYTAGQALEHGLIDGIEYLPDTISTLKKALALEEARVIRYLPPGAHGGSVYSIKDSTVNVLSLDAGALAGLEGPEFMYIWPGR